MATKLTLSINEGVIKKAKTISRKRGKSLSKIVEEYLQQISNDSKNKVPATSKLRGGLVGSMIAAKDIKDAKEKYLKQKYGV
jgi:hypothetical protein